MLWESEFDSKPTKDMMIFMEPPWSLEAGRLESCGCSLGEEHCYLVLPIGHDSARVYVEFEFLHPRGPFFGIGFRFDSWEDGDYLLWVYQTAEGDRYQLVRIYREDYQPYVVAEDTIHGLNATGINAIELTIAGGSVELVLNGDSECRLEGIGATAQLVSIPTFHTDCSVDYMKVDRYP